MNYNDIWNECLKEIEENISKANFNTWFKETFILKEENGVIFLGVPNSFVKDWLENKFHKLIIKTLLKFESSIKNVKYVISSKKENENKIIFEPKLILNKKLPLNEYYIDKETNLNLRYTFNNFIVGAFNELAHAAAQAIINNPGKIYNPFFVYGGTGLGKTHLIQAIGNTLKENFNDKKIFYTTLEKYALDYINSVQLNKINHFKEKYRKYDVLIIDDVQFIAKMDKTQEELFHLFNDFHENRKQIVFSSDKHPNFIPGLEDRLRSRFSAGMIVDIIPPEFESRLAILKTKAQENNLEISDDILEYIASSIEGNIRELEGILNTLICQIQLRNKILSLYDVKNIIKSNLKPKRNISPNEVVKTIANFYNLNENLIYEKIRRKDIVKVRQISMYILREMFGISFPTIGEKLGGKDHTTVIHSYEKIKRELKENNLLSQEIEQIKSLFK